MTIGEASAVNVLLAFLLDESDETDPSRGIAAARPSGKERPNGKENTNAG